MYSRALDKEHIVPWADQRRARVNLGQVKVVVLEDLETVAECSWKSMVHREHEQSFITGRGSIPCIRNNEEARCVVCMDHKRIDVSS